MPRPSKPALAVTAAIGILAVAGLVFDAPESLSPTGASAAGIFAAPTAAADLIDNSLIYSDAEGTEHTVFFGRFGNFDWYFPCEFESGTWTFDAALTLSLTYDNPQFTAQQFRMASVDGKLILSVPGGGAPTRAEIARGNRLPFG